MQAKISSLQLSKTKKTHHRLTFSLTKFKDKASSQATKQRKAKSKVDVAHAVVKKNLCKVSMMMHSTLLLIKQ